MNEQKTVKAQSEEKMLEALYEYAASCHADNILKEYPIEDDSNPQFFLPPEFNQKMKMIITKYERKESWNRTRKRVAKIAPKAAIFLLVLIGSLTIVVASVNALRVKALNIILNIQDQYTSIQTEDENNSRLNQAYEQTPQNWNGYVPTYVPPGFNIIKTKASNLMNVIYYTNKQDQTIEFTQYLSNNTDLRLDTEAAAVESITINSNDALLSEKQGIISIAWKEGYLFSLTGEADKVDMLKMAESIKKSK